MIEIVALGWGTTIQDAGRPGYGDLGVPSSGALDGALRALVNRLVGNPEGAAVLETAGGLVVRATSPAVVATSAELAARAVTSGELIEIAPAAGQLWGYFAVRGGLAVEAVLGSRSHDSLSGLGPPALQVGAALAVGADPATSIVVDQAPPPILGKVVAIWAGPRLDWFEPGMLDRLADASWTVSSDVSRVGMRLQGPALARRIADELPSEGLVTGAIQVPADGQPVVMLADHPTTGGYPVIAVVDPASLRTVVQSRPGTTIRFSSAT